MRRHLTAVAALFAGVGLMATAACGTSVKSGKAGTATAASPSPSPKSPKDVLVAAAPDGSQGTFQCAVTEPNYNESGPVDPADKKMQWKTVYHDPKLGYEMTITFLIVDQQTWMKVGFTKTQNVTGLPRLPTGWMLMDRSKLTGAGTDIAGFTNPDPAGVQSLLGAITDATRADDGTYQGTLDLTQASDSDIVDSDELTALGDRAKSVPFQAALDSAHRLTSVTVDVPAAGQTAAYRYHVSYTDYGSAPGISAPPASQVQAAPAAAYALFN